MKGSLKNELCEYLGELMYDQENQFDWFSKDKITKRINAIHTLLEIESDQELFSDKIIEVSKKILKIKPFGCQG